MTIKGPMMQNSPEWLNTSNASLGINPLINFPSNLGYITISTNKCI